MAEARPDPSRQRDADLHRTDRRLVVVGLITTVVAAAPFLIRMVERPTLLGEPRNALCLAALIAFLGILAWPPPEDCERVSVRHRLIESSLLGGLAVAMIYLVPSSLFAVLLVIVGGSLGDVVRPATAIAWVSGLSLAVAPVFVTHQGWRDGLLILGSFVCFQLFALYTVHVAGAERDARRELAAVNQELHRTRERLAETSRAEERLRIARDLHDVVGHHLIALSLNLEAARHGDDEAVERHVETAHGVAQRLIGEVRRVVSTLRDAEEAPEAKCGAAGSQLASALTALGDGIERPRLRVEVDPAAGAPGAQTANTLLACAREVVTNAARHADADQLWLAVAARDGGVELTGRDDGRGSSAGPPYPGHGLRGMRERLETLGGRLEIDPHPGEGFEVRAWLPTA